MACMLGHARGQKTYPRSPARGDQADEVSKSGWYPGSGDHAWYVVFRPKERKVADLMVATMEAACRNANIGYSNGLRLGLYFFLKNNNWDYTKIDTINSLNNPFYGYGYECDCSSLIHVCCNCAGLDIPLVDNNAMVTYSYSEPVLLRRTGAFYEITNSKYTRQSSFLRAGDILLSQEHTALVVEDGERAYEIDEYPQVKNSIDSNAEVPKGKDQPSVTFKEKTIDINANTTTLEVFKKAYWDMYGMSFSWISYNSAYNNRGETHNDYAHQMVTYIIDNNGSCDDDIFNEWATARLIKMLNSGYNMNNAAVVERVLRLYEKTDNAGIKKYISEKILNWTMGDGGTPQNENDFKTAYQREYPSSDLSEFNHSWNQKTDWSREPYFRDVFLSTDEGLSIGILDPEEETIVPSQMSMKDFDEAMFEGRFIEYVFSEFLKAHSDLLLWKYNSSIQSYSYVPEDENKWGQLKVDWEEMVDSKNIKWPLTGNVYTVDKSKVIDVYPFTKNKSFALNATINKLTDLDQTVFFDEDGWLVIQNRVNFQVLDENDQDITNSTEAKDKIDPYTKKIQQWDHLVDFSFYANDYEYYYDSHWAYAVDEAPYNLLFWLEFLDTDGDVSRYNVPSIGPRQKALNDSKVRVITYDSTPNVIFVTDKDQLKIQQKQQNFTFSQEDLDELDILSVPSEKYASTGYTRLYLPGQYRQLFTISAQGKTAKDVIDELLYNNTHALETMSITSLPIYYLEPNTRIGVYDNKVGLDHEYIINKITLPLTYNGTMSLQVSKTIDRLY